MTVMICESVAVPVLEHVTTTDTVRLVPTVTPVIEIEDVELLPLNPVPTVQA